MDRATKEFIQKYTESDVFSLSLQKNKFPNVDFETAIRQIIGKQKIKSKIPTFWNNTEILYPQKLSLEQSSSEITAKHKSMRCKGEKLVDLTGGFGVDSYFFSFHFDTVFYVEKNEELCRIGKHNFAVLRRDNIQIINDFAENYLDTIEEQIDWIYLDPARRGKDGKKVMLLDDCEPNVKVLITKLLEKSNNVMIKLSPMIDISSLFRELPFISQIEIISVENECKEVLVILNKNETENNKINTYNYRKNNKVDSFHFLKKEENNTEIKIANQFSTFLYEPNSAILKSGAFQLIGSKFNISKLHINSHLYTSDELIEDFPGRIFTVEEIFLFDKNAKSAIQKITKTANVATRNFPISPQELKKKLQISDGGTYYLFGTTLFPIKKTIVLCKKIIDSFG